MPSPRQEENEVFTDALKHSQGCIPCNSFHMYLLIFNLGKSQCINIDLRVPSEPRYIFCLLWQ